ncbi:MAG: acylphosphatase [Fibrobacterota bacterium]
MIAKTGTVEGRVQGVGYRYFAQETAVRLGLFGWVRNLPEGSVEYYVQGPEPAVAEFIRKLEEGPPLSRVERVTRGGMPVDLAIQGFRVMY